MVASHEPQEILDEALGIVIMPECVACNHVYLSGESNVGNIATPIAV
jgi:hypothetical protein